LADVVEDGLLLGETAIGSVILLLFSVYLGNLSNKLSVEADLRVISDIWGLRGRAQGIREIEVTKSSSVFTIR
jgi:hypothetical protein